jgi:cation diffusion facilitator CzcD-associated flavoprotein CzcO
VAARSDALPVVVVGAGPAGLATARELGARGLSARVLERGAQPGESWRNLYDSLTLHTGKHMSALPGMRFPSATPLFPRRLDFVDYLDAYRDRFDLRVETGTDVLRVERSADAPRWRIHTSAGTVHADALVLASGIMANPVTPLFEGRERYRGRVLHSVEYLRPDPFLGQRVLVVGVGNSGGEIGSELARAGIDVSIAVRSGANVVPLTILGVPVQYIAYGLRRLPAAARVRIAEAVTQITEARRGPPVLPRPAHGPLDAIPLIGFHLVDAIAAGRVRVRPALLGMTETGARFADGRDDDFDTIILATGFRPALAPVQHLVRTDAKGFALRSDRVTSADQAGLYFVGHNYDATGGLMNIVTDARLVAQAIAAGDTPGLRGARR